MNNKDPYWKDQPLIDRLRLLQKMCVTETSREVAEQCIILSQKMPDTLSSAAVDAGWKCANAAMVLHDHYRASGDKENAEVCKKISQEWREALRGDRVWTAQEVNAILGEAEKQVESMSDGKVVPNFAALAKKHGLQ